MAHRDSLSVIGRHVLLLEMAGASFIFGTLGDGAKVFSKPLGNDGDRDERGH